MQFKTFSEAYKPLVEKCLADGVEFTPRDYVCLELRPFQFTINDPSEIYLGKSRRLNYRFFAVETMGYISGVDDKWFVDLLVDVNKRMRMFVNPTTDTFDGMYGPRLRQSLPDIVKLFRQDPSTRQAVASIWKPGLPTSSLDVPCTVALHFINVGTQHEPKLGLNVYMRSNDLNWGTPYDVMAFSTIQCLMASMLKWPVGKYTHFTGSLHLYVDQLPDLSDESTDWCPLNPTVHVPDYVDFESMRSDFEGFLREVYDHRGRPWKDFGMENMGTVYNWWRDLIRFGRG